MKLRVLPRTEGHQRHVITAEMKCLNTISIATSRVLDFTTANKIDLIRVKKSRKARHISEQEI